MNYCLMKVNKIWNLISEVLNNCYIECIASPANIRHISLVGFDWLTYLIFNLYLFQINEKIVVGDKY